MQPTTINPTSTNAHTTNILRAGVFRGNWIMAVRRQGTRIIIQSCNGGCPKIGMASFRTRENGTRSYLNMLIAVFWMRESKRVSAIGVPHGRMATAREV
jgi:hypothetical protein